MKDPIGSFEDLQSGIKRYITSAFSTNSGSFENDRGLLLDLPGVLFQVPFIEPIPSYKSGKALQNLSSRDLPGLNELGQCAFKAVVEAGLFNGGYPLYLHQQEMLRKSLEGKHCVVVTGTGSGKTESFILPALASIIKEATTPQSRWPKPSKKAARWTEDKPPKWSDTRKELRGEERTAAVRALILYPMNALVEDQVSRLRAALDSDTVHSALDRYLDGNRIRFGRYNGSTPIAGHPFKEDGKANSTKRSALNAELKSAIAEYGSMLKKIERCRQELAEAERSAQPRLVRECQSQLKESLEELEFIQRMSPDAAELFHRWEMQATPPDILVTNVSMLSIMLMRHTDPQLSGDRADSDIFEATKDWLAEDRENHVFQLIIDELHLHRSSAGTEVAYLTRMLLNRLGLSPDSRQLRILASSASLDGEDDITYEYLGNFFGYTPKEAKSRFHIEAGQHQYTHKGDIPEFGDDLISACVRVGKDEFHHEGENGDITTIVDALASNAERANLQLLAAFNREGQVAAQPLNEVATALFPKLNASDSLFAARGLLKAIGSDCALP